MTYEEIVAKAKASFGTADVSNYEGHLAIQINITGEGEGIFYAEINEGKLYIEPYDYKGYDAALTAEGKDIIKIFNGTLDPAKAFEAGKLSVDGDLNKALSIVPVIENNKKSAKKPAAKKSAPAKKAADTKKAAAKKAPEKKVTEKKAADKKAAEKKAETEKKTTEAVKAAEKAVKAAPKAPKTTTTVKKAEEEVKPIIGLADPKKAPAKATAPKTAAKKPAPKAAKESTKSVKKASTASKNKKG